MFWLSYECFSILRNAFLLKSTISSHNSCEEAVTLTKRVMLSMISSISDPLGFATLFMLDGRRILQGLCNQDIQWEIEISGAVKKD